MVILNRIIPVAFLYMIVAYSCSTPVTREIETGELQDHVKFLSSDSLKGRQTGTPGDSLAAYYIKFQLSQAGLKPLSGDGFQRYKVADKVTAGEKNFLSVDVQNFNLTTGIMPFSFSGTSELEAEVVFAGYGFVINNDTIQWNDYEKNDVKGKWVLILRGDPEPNKSVSGFIPFNSDRDKALLAKDMGASCLLYTSDAADE